VSDGHDDHLDHLEHIDNSLLVKAKRTLPLAPLSRGLSQGNMKAASDTHKLQDQEGLGTEGVDDSGKHLHQREYEFHNNYDLARTFDPWFTNVQVLEPEFPQRRNPYFWASDSAVGP